MQTSFGRHLRELGPSRKITRWSAISRYQRGAWDSRVGEDEEHNGANSMQPRPEQRLRSRTSARG